MPEELWTEVHNIVQEAVIKIIPEKKNCKKAKWLSEVTLQIAEKTRDDSTREHHQMVKTENRLIIFFAAKDGETLYSQQKQDWELTVAQNMNSLLPNSDLN